MTIALRRLYLVRFAFALVWAVLLFVTGSGLGALSVSLLVLYPLFDAAAAVVDLRSSRSAALYVNLAISSLAAVGLAVACSAGIPAVLRVWGAWAIGSGLIQLAVGVSRRHLGGQWPMILSGGISTLAGTSFILQAAADGASLRSLAGYALLGGIFFLTSAVRLGRTAVARA
ncbi:hypothetical protein [Actinoplanes subtropicus]|uniref:hypothetical protein n=1 Tax=Actinoplanes subtropicus TaxID=543632 RepID=UPI0004C3467D|nr:hypothetical protein [Actinoplanes subtropicus]